MVNEKTLFFARNDNTLQITAGVLSGSALWSSFTTNANWIILNYGITAQAGLSTGEVYKDWNLSLTFTRNGGLFSGFGSPRYNLNYGMYVYQNSYLYLGRGEQMQISASGSIAAVQAVNVVISYNVNINYIVAD